MRPKINHVRRAITLETGRRSVDLPVDAAGNLRRFVPLVEPAVTRAEDDDGTKPIGFRGHAAVFNQRTWIGSRKWGFWEEIAPGAFEETIRTGDIRFLHNHNPDLVLARNTAGNLRLSEDDIGLKVDADMTPTSYARDLALSLDAGDVSQMSFGFRMVDYEWREADDGEDLLIHQRVEAFDVSTVTFPAYTQTDASLRLDLLAVARAAGFGSLDLDRLGRRLQEPDDEVIEALRALAAAKRAEVDEDTERAEETPEDAVVPDPEDRRRDAAFAAISMEMLGDLIA